MQTMETGSLADRLAAIGRWTTLVILALVFAASNNFDAISAFIFAIVLLWTVVLTLLNLFGRRLPGTPWSMILGSCCW